MRRHEMKKLVVYYPGKWAERLLTLERYREVAYFIDDEVPSDFNFANEQNLWKQKIYPTDILQHEEKDNLVVLIADNARYSRAKDTLEAMGLIENFHFFNGWKLDLSFYKRYFGDNSWSRYETVHAEVIRDRSYDLRTDIMAQMIPADALSVMDIGCGEAFLKRHLPPGVQYWGVDICIRPDAAFVCDVNHESLPTLPVDLYYMAGLLYYVNDIDHLISQMTHAKYILFDYGGSERYLRLDGVPHDPLVQARSNFCSWEDIFNILRKHGFVMEEAYWNPQIGKIGWHIYLFKKNC